jgi:ammonium transporter, Amt family
MKIFRMASATCALAILILAGAGTVARADAAPSASAAELKDAASKAPTTSTLAAGDPGGTITGTVSDVPVSDSKAGLSLGDVANQVGQNKIGINFTWTLLCGFLVMFMQAGFAMVESGLCRVKNANHTYMMNFFVYGCGLFAYWILGFAIQMGGAAGNGNLGGLQPLVGEHTLSLFGKTWGIFGQSGMFLSGHSYDVGVMVIFLFQMVFMDTALTIVTGACAERWKFLTFSVSSVLMGAIT